MRQLYAEGKVGREELLEAESASYHSKGTCTFYGTANSNQMLMEVMGLHLPDATFVNPGTPLRAALDRAAGERAVAITAAAASPPRSATSSTRSRSSTPASRCSRPAARPTTRCTWSRSPLPPASTLTWDDLSDLSAAVPLLTRIYPNGSADINHFVAAGGTPFLIHTLLKHGYLHDDVLTVSGRGLWRHTREARLDGDAIVWEEGPKPSLDTVGAAPGRRPVRPRRRAADAVRSARTGRRQDVRRQARAPGRHGPGDGLRRPGRLPRGVRRGPLDDRDLVAVVRYQGPAANGMPELHKLMPALGVLQDRGQTRRDRHRRPDVRRLGQGASPPST